MRNFSIMSLFLFIGSVFSSTVYITDDSTYVATLVPTLPVGTTVLFSDHTNDAQLIQEAVCESIGHVINVGCGNFGDNPVPVGNGVVQFWLDWEFGDGTGVYDLNDNIYLYSGMTIGGYVNGDEIIDTTLRVPNGRCQDGEVRSGVLIIENQQDIVIGSLRLDGNQCNQNCVNGNGDTGVYIRYSSNIMFGEMEIVHFVKHAIHFRDSSGLTFNFGIEDPYSRVTDNSQYGFMLEDSDTVNLEHMNNNLLSLGQMGLRIKNTNDVVVTSNNCDIDNLYGAFVKYGVSLTNSRNFRCDVV